MANAINFSEEIEKLLKLETLIDANSHTSILGGEFDAEKVESFLSLWKMDEMPDRIWEYAHRITFNEPKMRTPELLERAMLFGKGGCLNLRRDRGKFRWHFIGEPQDETKKKVEEEGFKLCDFWAENKDVKLRRSTESALLWGENNSNGDGWQEDRVGWAELIYPFNATANRVEVEYEVFTQNGQVAFVWWKKLKELKVNG